MPVHLATEITPEQARAYRLADLVAERWCESPTDSEAARMWARLVEMNTELFGGPGKA